MPKRKEDDDKDYGESESITLRMDKNMLTELRKEAEHKMESVNTLANQVFRSYISWHKPATKAGSFYMPKPVIVKLLEDLSDDQIVKVAEYWITKHEKDTITMMTNEFNISSYFDSFRTWLDLSNFSYVYNIKDGVESYVIKFDMDRKFNFFMGKSLQFVLGLLEIKPVKFEITEYTVMFKFKRE
ncbi:MAG: hypothetical protein M3162_02480 [Thermoproteota archaeon]|nr:hypothetical protein [Thermoproteota archaeon]